MSIFPLGCRTSRQGRDLVVAPPTRRSIRLLYPDGRPLMGAEVGVSLYGSSRNHCGVAVGIGLGTFTTNADGELAVMAPADSLALSITYYEAEDGGPAGEAFSGRQDLIVGGAPAITLKKLWTLPEHDYVVSIGTTENQPVVHAHLTACMNFDGCGAGCGPMIAPESDASGTIRFRRQDLRLMRSITVVSEKGEERDLTEPEMHDLLSNYRLNVRWD